MSITTKNKCPECSVEIPKGFKVTNCYWNGTDRGHGVEPTTGVKSGMEQVQLKDVKKGEFIRRKADAKATYIKGDYDRSEKDYSCINFDDINKEIFIKGTTKVWVGFTF